MAEQDRDQQTEDATPERIRKAREEGQIGVSTDFLAGAILATCVLLFWGFGYTFFGEICETLKFRLTFFDDVARDPRMLVGAAMNDAKRVGGACLIMLLPIVFATTAGGLFQTNFNISFKPLNLDLNKLSIKSGIGRIFNTKSLVRGALSLAKAALILMIAYVVVKSQLDEIALSGFGSIADMLFFLCAILMTASFAVAAMMVVVGIVDLAFQKWKHLQELKMSLRDIKDEHKESEGDPMVRARLKRLRAEMSRTRMLADVPRASVVITNPTHFAVAVEYDPEKMEAPIVLAKGADHLAKKIIEIAKENDVAVVERKPVARFLYANVEIGQTIPVELYQAVAEILNFVNRVKAA